MDRVGLAMESAKILTKKDGAIAAKRRIGAIEITDVKLNANAAARVGQREGRYITLCGEPDAVGMTPLLERALRQLLPPHGRLFAAGLGNPDLTQDSLGALCVRSMIPRKGTRYSLFAIETDVAAKTGLETARLVKAAAHELRADCVIAVDALSCGDPRNIGKTVQIGSAGIIPGSGMGAGAGELSEEKLGVPIVSVGVPTVTALSSITKNSIDSGFFVFPPDVYTIINMWTEVIAGAVSSLAVK